MSRSSSAVRQLASVVALAGALATPAPAAIGDLVQRRTTGPSCSAAALSGSPSVLAALDGQVSVVPGRGELLVHLPAATRAACARSVEFVVTAESSGAPAAVERVAVSGAGSTLSIPVPVSGDAFVEVALEGSVDGEVVTTLLDSGSVWVAVDAVDDCLHRHGAMSFGSDLLTVDAVTVPGSLSIAVRPAEVPPCLDSATLTVTVLSDLEAPEAGVEALDVDLRAGRGASTVLALAQDDYLVYADIRAGSAGDTSERQGYYAGDGAAFSVTAGPGTPSSGPAPSGPGAPGAPATAAEEAPSHSADASAAVPPSSSADAGRSGWVGPAAAGTLLASAALLVTAERLRRRVGRRSSAARPRA